METKTDIKWATYQISHPRQEGVSFCTFLNNLLPMTPHYNGERDLCVYITWQRRCHDQEDITQDKVMCMLPLLTSPSCPHQEILNALFLIVCKYVHWNEFAGAVPVRGEHCEHLHVLSKELENVSFNHSGWHGYMWLFYSYSVTSLITNRLLGSM